MSISSVKALQQTLNRLDSKERVVCKWECFDGRKVEILQGEIDGVCRCYHVVFDQREDITGSIDVNPTAEISLEDYMQVKGITDSDEGKRSYLQSLSEITHNTYFNQIPLLTQDGQIQDYLAVDIVHQWNIENEMGPHNPFSGIKTVSLLKKPLNVADQSWIWRFTTDKVHTLIEGHRNVVCCFPKVNGYYPLNFDWVLEHGAPVTCPLAIETLEQSFLRDHSVKEIRKTLGATERSVVYVLPVQLDFSPIYHKEKSKFNPGVFVTPYEWGVTLISYSNSSGSNTFGINHGHAAIVVESVKDGKYYAEQIHVCHWDNKKRKTNYPSDALEIRIGEAGSVRAIIGADGREEKIVDEESGNEIIKRHFVWLKNTPTSNLRSCYEDLSHSRVWVRKKEAVENMISYIRRMHDRQERNQEPLFYFRSPGQSADGKTHFKLALSSLGAGILAIETAAFYPLMMATVAFGLSSEVMEPRPKELRHNCLTWAIEMLKNTDININEGMGMQKHIASIPKVYAQSYLSTLNETDNPMNRKNWEDFFISHLSSVNSSLDKVFTESSFIKTGSPSVEIERQITELIENKFLKVFSHKMYLKKLVIELMTAAGLKFHHDETSRFIEPLMSRIINNKELSNVVIKKLKSRNIHIEIKECKDWEVHTPNPETYYQTIRKIFAHCLIFELYQEILRSMKYTHYNTTFV